MAVRTQRGKAHDLRALKILLTILCGVLFLAGTLHSQTIDPIFNPNTDAGTSTMAVQPDGKILVGGGFELVSNQIFKSFARINADGSLDTLFNPFPIGGFSGIALQTDGKILVVGGFNALGGQVCSNLARLNPDGTLDPSFACPGTGTIVCLTVQSDGQILVGGTFTNLGGLPHNFIGRVGTNGVPDASFNPAANSAVECITVEPDGKILVGGAFTNLGGMPVSRIGRLNPDGSVDTNFTASADGTVRSIALQTNGQIIVGGSFSNLSGFPHVRIGRLQSDGTVDGGFTSSASSTVEAISLQANGKILVGGNFTTLSGTSRNFIGRLNSNGTIDGAFNPAPNALVNVVQLQPDGKILVGGNFTNLAGVARNFSGRLLNDDAATQTLTNDSSSVTWMRGGGSPEVWRTTFDVSTDGTNWTTLGDGIRIEGGWQLTGLSIPSAAYVRARGFVASGQTFGTCWFAETICGPPLITVQPASVKAVPGTNATLSVMTGGTTPLFYQWQKNGANVINSTKISGATTNSLVLSNLVATNAGAYTIIVSNTFGATTSAIAALTVVSPITNDPFFTAGLGLTSAIAFQADGKALFFGGSFGTKPAGQSNFFDNIARANTNGSLDTPFFVIGQGNVNALLVQTDGKILVGGGVGQSHPGLNRFNPDGSLDTSFTTSANGKVFAMLLQPDGKTLLGGSFTSVGGQPHTNIAQLDADGSVDGAFNPSANGSVMCLALQTNGQIVVGGTFSNLNGVTCTNIGRLNADGTTDTNFNASFDNSVLSLLVQPDGKILVAGNFITVENQQLIRARLCRLNPDGTADTTLTANLDNLVNSLALQTDGKIMIGGAFSLVNSTPNRSFARLNHDGSLDTTFRATTSATLDSLALQADGKVLLGGTFGSIIDSTGSSPGRNGLGRISTTEVGTQNLAYDASTITWLRGGTSPECAWVAFDSSPDGTNWTLINTAAQISGGWQLAGVSLSPSTFIRARGYVTSGQGNGSGWFAFSQIGPPFITTQPASLTNNAGTRATFSVTAVGTAPITYQWLKNANPLTNGANISGANLPTLTLQGVLGNDAAGYSVVLTNSSGIATSQVASLNVINPQTPPQILSDDGNTGIVAGQFGFDIRTVFDQTVIIERSTDLIFWTPILTNTINTLPYHFTDPTPINSSQTFYRLRLP